MTETSRDKKSSAFSWWLRTGRLPAASFDGFELKFNPWHDPADGRFTFAGAGRHYGAGEADAVGGASSRTSARAGAAPASADRAKSRTAKQSKQEKSRAKPAASDARTPVGPVPPPVQPKSI